MGTPVALLRPLLKERRMRRGVRVNFINIGLTSYIYVSIYICVCIHRCLYLYVSCVELCIYIYLRLSGFLDPKDLIGEFNVLYMCLYVCIYIYPNPNLSLRPLRNGQK